MQQHDHFRAELNAITSRYDLNSYHEFNLFRTMYKMTEEKNLHSRFIAFLLNPKGTHGKGNLFLKLFLEHFEFPYFDLDGILVLPDETIKKEEDNIDILITNSSNQAIIIENKIFAGDSDKLDLEVDEQENDLFRKFQLPRYYDIVLNAKGNQVVSMLYLTIDGKKPKCYPEFPKEINWNELIICKEYLKHIPHWLLACINQLKENSYLKGSIEQYRQATLEFLNDIHLADDLKNLTALHLESGYDFWINKYTEGIDNAELLLNQFMHVKWHTVFDFYRLLRESISGKYGVEVSLVDNEKITSVAHRNSKTKLIVSFEFNGSGYYVCNDQNGFSIGCNKEEKLPTYYKFLFNKNYGYFDFTKREVFELIKEDVTKELIKKIENELSDFIR